MLLNNKTSRELTVTFQLIFFCLKCAVSLNPVNSESDQHIHLIFLHNITPKSNITVTKIHV